MKRPFIIYSWGLTSHQERLLMVWIRYTMLKFSLGRLLLGNKVQKWMYLLLFLNIAFMISFHLIQVLEQLRISFKLSSAKMNSIISTGIILVIIKSSTSRKSSLSCLCRHLNNLNNGILSDFDWQYHRYFLVEKLNLLG